MREADRRLGVLRDDELEALVEPPVRAAAMQSVALDVVQRGGRAVGEADAEDGRVDRVERGAVGLRHGTWLGLGLGFGLGLRLGWGWAKPNPNRVGVRYGTELRTRLGPLVPR